MSMYVQIIRSNYSFYTYKHVKMCVYKGMKDMLWYIMVYYGISCYVMLCYVMLCYVMLCYVMLCYVML